MDRLDPQSSYSFVAEQSAGQYTQGTGKKWVAQRFLESRGEHESPFLTVMREQFYRKLEAID